MVKLNGPMHKGLSNPVKGSGQHKVNNPLNEATKHIKDIMTKKK